ncbi:MAG: hypothetical protein N2Z62_06335 [Rhodobacteraceae bacterium]|nr:hypothetical protein [Paracoccaceae bacterium]
MRFGLLAALAACAALPAGAQSLQTAGRGGSIAGACGQPQALTYSLPGPLDRTAMAPLSVEIERAEPVYLEFTLEAAARVVLRTEAPEPDTDPYLALLGAGGAVIAEDDDLAGALQAMIDAELAAGTYCAQLRIYGGTTDARPRITLSAATGEDAAALAAIPPAGSPDTSLNCTDPALTRALGTVLGPGFGRFSEAVEVPQGARSDWRISVAEATPFQADTANSDLDTTLTLSDLAGNVIASNDDGFGAGTDSRVVAELQPGDYCLSVAGYGGAAGRTTLVFSDTPETPIAGDISTACTDPALTRALGTTLVPGVGRAAVGGTLAPNGRSDWTVEVGEAGTFQFDAASTAFDTVLTLLDAGGTVLQTNDDREGSIDSRIVAELAPGSYCLAVESLGGSGSGPFELSATDEISGPEADLPDEMPCSMAAITEYLGEPLAAGFGSRTIDTTVEAESRRDLAFALAAPMTLRFDARSASFDTILRLADASGGTVAENDDGPSGTDSSFSLALEPGDYCLTLEGFVGAGGPAQLVVAEVGAPTSGTPTPESGEVIPPPGSGIAVEDLGTLEASLQTNAAEEAATKWVAFSTGSAGRVTVNAVSASGGFVLRLFSADGTRLGAAESAAGLTPATLSLDLAPGRYLVSMALPPDSPSRLRNIVITRD